MLSGLIGSILGFGSSVVPAITEHYKSKRQMEFELKKMEKMAELKAQGYDHEIKRFAEMGLHEEQGRFSHMTQRFLRGQVLCPHCRSRCVQ